MFQMKEQNKAPDEELSRDRQSAQEKVQFKLMIAKMVKELRRRMDERSKKLFTKS